jgi:hypothetical protein
VYHRLLKVVIGAPASKRYVQNLRSQAETLYQQWRGHPWSSDAACGIHAEVNTLKHTPEGVYPGRGVIFSEAVGSIAELLDLMDAWCEASDQRGTVRDA